MGFGVNRAMGNFPLLAMLLVPHTTASAQDRAIDGYGSAGTSPWLDQVHQMAAQATDLGRQGLGDGFQAAFPRATRGKPTLFVQQPSQRRHLSGWLRQHAEEFIDLMQVTDNHDH